MGTSSPRSRSGRAPWIGSRPPGHSGTGSTRNWTSRSTAASTHKPARSRRRAAPRSWSQAASSSVTRRAGKPRSRNCDKPSLTLPTRGRRMVHVWTESSRSASYTVVALKASPITGTPLGPIMNGVRIGLVAVTLLVSIALLILALHVPPFMPAGADLADSGQRHYAANIWQETQTSLALVAIVLPWLVYGLLWRGAPWGRRIFLATSAAALAVATWFVLPSAQSYSRFSRQVPG